MASGSMVSPSAAEGLGGLWDCGYYLYAPCRQGEWIAQPGLPPEYWASILRLLYTRTTDTYEGAYIPLYYMLLLTLHRI